MEVSEDGVDAWPMGEAAVPSVITISDAMKKIILWTSLLVVSAILLSGLFASRTNPTVENEVAWDSASTREQFMKSCADCHSHQTRWPWYSHVGPVAFLVSHNVQEGREHFNVSSRRMGEPHEAAEEVLEGEMPPRDYLLLHPEAALDDAKRKEFAQGLSKTFGGGSHEHHDED